MKTKIESDPTKPATIEIKDNLTADSTINITRAVTINGNGKTINGFGFAGRLFSVSTGGKVIFNEDDKKALQSLDGDLTFSGASGGVLFVTSGTVEFYRTKFLNNGNAVIDGGAVDFKGTKLILNSCIFDGNNGARGGAINSNKPVIVINSEFKATSDSVFLDAGQTTKGSAFINNNMGSVPVVLAWEVNAFHYNIHSGTPIVTVPNPLLRPPTNGGLSSMWPGDVPKFDAGRPNGGFWERHFRKDKVGEGGNSAVDDGPFESNSRPPKKFGLLNVSTGIGYAEPSTGNAIVLSTASVTYDGGWSLTLPKPTVSIAPKSIETNTLQPFLFIPEDLDVTIGSDLSGLPGVDIEEILVDGANITSPKKFLAGASGVSANGLHDVSVKFKDIVYTIKEGEHQVIDPETKAISDATDVVYSLTNDSGSVSTLSPGETVWVHLKHGKGYVVGNIAFGLAGETNASRKLSNKVVTDDGADTYTGLTFDTTRGDSNNTYYTLEVTEGLAGLAEGNDAFSKTITLSFTLSQPLYELYGIVDPRGAMPTDGTGSRPTGSINGKIEDTDFLPASKVATNSLDLTAVPNNGYNFVGWMRWQDYNDTIDAQIALGDTDPNSNNWSTALRADELKFLYKGLNPDSTTLDKNMSDGDVDPDFKFRVVALFEPKKWNLVDINNSKSIRGAIGEDVPAVITVVPDKAKSSDGRYYDGTKVEITIRPDKSYQFMGFEGVDWIASPGEDSEGLYYILKPTMNQDYTPVFVFSLRDFRMEQLVRFGAEGAIKTTTRHALGDVVQIELGDESGYAFDGWKLEKYSRLTGRLEYPAIWDKNGTPARLEISSSGEAAVSESNATLENNSTIVISGIRDDYLLTTFYNRKAVVVTTQVDGNGSIEPNTADRTYTVGDTLQLIAKPAPGFRFVEWKDDRNQSLSTLVQFDFPPMASDQNITAVFTPEEYTVTSSPLLPPGFEFNSNALRYPDTNKSELISGGPYFYGEKVTVSSFKAPPGWINKGGYSIYEDSGQTISYSDNNNSETLSFVIKSNVTIRAKLDPDLADTDGDGLTNHQEFEIWGPAPNDVSLAILAGDSDKDGFIDGWEVAYGFDPNLKGDPVPGDDLDGDGLTNLQESQLDTNATNKDTDGDGFTDSYEVNDLREWSPVDRNYTIEVSKVSLVPLANLTPDDLGEVKLGIGGSPFEGMQTKDENEFIEVYAEAKPDYDFLNWSLVWDRNASPKVIAQLEDLNSSRSTLNPLPLEVHADIEVAAVFVPKGSFYTVNLSVAPSPDGALGTVRVLPDDGIYLADANVTIDAVAIDGYFFGGWKGDINSTANPLVLSLDRSLSLVASFYRKGSVLTLLGSVTKIEEVFPGVIEGTGVAAQNEVRKLKAKPYPGYLFSNWAGDIPWKDSDENVTITVSQDYIFTATFRKDTNDSDGDGLDNYTEIVVLKTNPVLADTDGDGMNDGYEFLKTLDPLRSDIELINLIKTEPAVFNILLRDESELIAAHSQGFDEGNAAAVKLWADFNSTMAHINERNDLYRFIAGPSAPGQTGLGWFYTEQHGWAWLRPSSPGWIYLHNGHQLTIHSLLTLNWLNLNPGKSVFEREKKLDPSYQFSLEQFFMLQGQDQNGTNRELYYPSDLSSPGSPSSGNGNNSNTGGNSQGNSGTGSGTDSNDGFGDLFRN
ncbi:hypothetical protein N9D63_07405 [Opitutales bacterium]|nr:hypothetical protein [Opitutales bacterium]